jgi:hypothetical protein
MNPWMTGRIIEHMQAEARESARTAQLHRAAIAHRRHAAPEIREPRRARVGLAVARVGLRIAGRRAEPAAVRRAFPCTTLEATH